MHDDMKTDKNYRVSPYVFYRDIGDKAVLYNTSEGTIYTFNSTAGMILDFLAENSSYDELICFLADQVFDAQQEEIEESIGAFVDELAEEGILQCITSEADGGSLDLENKAAEEFVRNKRLYSATIELTYRCNESCRHCYVSDPGGKELDKAQVMRVLDELREMGVMTVTFTGGEIFVRKDIFEILEHAYQKGLVIELFTNGTLLDSDKILRLKAIWPRNISFSVYSHIDERHDGITKVPGSLQRTLKAIEKCRLVGIPVKIKMPVFEETKDDIEGVIELARKLGAAVGIGDDIIPKKDGDTSPLKMRVSRETHIAVSAVIGENLGNPDSSKNDPEGRICGAGVKMISINPYGKVFPCVSFPLCIGDVTEQSLKDIWENSPELNQWRLLNHSRNRKECLNCSSFEKCGFCPGEAYMYTGIAVRKYDDACFLAKRSE